MTEAPDIAGNLARVHERIAAAVARRGPGPAPLLIGVSKLQPLPALQRALAAGLTDLGENYAQELRDKIAELGHDPPRWHFIGALQTNKIKYIVGRALIHTVDRPELLAPIAARAGQGGLIQELLIEVNLGDEAQKAGVHEAHLPALLDQLAAYPALRCSGLMLIPPVDDPAQTRRYFARLRRLRDHLAGDARPGVALDHLSMGMSADYEGAIEEGATMVRVGAAIFGARPR